MSLLLTAVCINQTLFTQTFSLKYFLNRLESFSCSYFPFCSCDTDPRAPLKLLCLLLLSSYELRQLAYVWVSTRDGCCGVHVGSLPNGNSMLCAVFLLLLKITLLQNIC
uniref:Putative secreted protein n=1 Tax=Amblyomma triste TaxID=251400 RepID=A0A023G1M3_AMBTT